MAARGSAKAGPLEPRFTDITYLEHLGYATDNLGSVLRSAGLFESILPTLEALGLDPGLRLEEHHGLERPRSEHAPAYLTIPLEEGRTVNFWSGKLQFYRRCWNQDECNLDRSGPVVLTREQCTAKLQRIADAQGENLRFSEEDILERRSLAPGFSLPVGYAAMHYRRYRGVKTEHFVGGTVCAHTGEVLWYRNSPPIDPPETMEIRITAKQAVNLALAKGVPGIMAWLGLKTEEEPSLVIVNASGYASRHGFSTGEDLPPRYRQCWDVWLGQSNFSRRLQKWTQGEEALDIGGPTIFIFYVDAYSGVVYDGMTGTTCE